MFRTRFTSVLTSVCLSALLSTALLGCSGSEPAMSTGPSPNSDEEKALKALKDKFFTDFNCAVYQKIVTFTCESGVVQVMCKDLAGMAQVAYFMKDPNTPGGWYSEKDVDAQIAAAEAQLLAAQMRKAAFAPAHNPGYQCSPL